MTISFDKRLAELDAYLQMLIDQTELLNNKIQSSQSDVEKDGLKVIKDNLDNLLASIKHSIVLLQIAKVSIKTTINERPQAFASQPVKAPPTTHSSSSSSGNINVSLSLEANKAHQTTLASSQEQLPTNSPKPPARASRRHSQQPSTPTASHKLPTSSSSSSTATAPATTTTQTSTTTTPSACSEPLTGSRRRSQVEIESAADTVINRVRDGAIVDSNSAVDSENLFPQSHSDGANEGGDDDDTFYDAADEHQLSSIVSRSSNILAQRNSAEYDHKQQDSSTSLRNSASNMNNNNNNNNNNNLNDSMVSGDGSIDWDALYDEEEDDLGSLENQGSVIKHLMSQIRIGMDLTKVVLPTFILERRSLLEMYADFFAHPDLFSSIPDYETPEERMVQLVRWYLSAFHAGRKSSVAKKPYNPILGEIFLCHWNLSNTNDKTQERNELSVSSRQSNNSTESATSISDIEKFSNQLPKPSLLFVAEQVSHHPPVSAFYAENPEKRISCCSHIYTKSKYLGLSVGVHNVGQGVINLLTHNETYICTFPSAYGRSILTVPWVELGGSVNITCEQTGYSASIEFVTKPFYGGKKHRVMGEILRPNKEPFMTIDGEWNGVMYSKSPSNSSEKRVFVDTTCLPVIKKHVRSISSQESFESRNVWKEVTRALKLRDVTSATAAKSFIEQRQRDLLKDRQENGVKWKSRYFEPADDGWIFAKPLAVRQRGSST